MRESQLIEEEVDECGPYYWPVIEDTIRESGFYTESFLTNEGCDSIFELDIILHPEYIIPDTILAVNAYTWAINNTSYTESGIYRLDFTTKNLCDSVHLLILTIDTESDIIFPNIISNNDINNTLTAYGSTIENIISLNVYDRWGNLISQKENISPNEPSLGWDGTYQGKKVLTGVYAFSCTLQLKDGTQITEYGDITVLH